MVAEQSVAEEKASAKPQEEQVSYDSSLPDLDYSPEQFMEAWQKYGQQVKAEGRQGEYIVLKEMPDLAENHVVRVRLTNSVQLDFFEKAKPAAQVYLRQALQNSQIRLEHVIVKEAEGKRLYTAHEKFGYLLKKYPQLQALKDKLGLEADF